MSLVLAKMPNILVSKLFELSCLSLVIEHQNLSCNQVIIFALMTDESTDSCFKAIGASWSIVGVKTSFLHIGNIVNGTAGTIEGAILQYLSDKNLRITNLLLVVMVCQ